MDVVGRDELSWTCVTDVGPSVYSDKFREPGREPKGATMVTESQDSGSEYNLGMIDGAPTHHRCHPRLSWALFRRSHLSR